jgi:hypothetical protein
MFRRLDSVPVVRSNLLGWAHSTELVPISGPEDGDRIQSPKRCVLNINRTVFS